ncbi:MAG: 16S rRNA (guanine(966)-N(2))-methyltransferase RsmD [Elusimicrobia bacterium]|nr:16S rRNA (guanine(966)-N(2))-methyltransferase RsmD [Elusimicrobiota bacterium]
MRIIAGSKKGRNLFSVSKTKNVKPISSRIKQSLFDIIRPHITGAIFLDLYAGVGSVSMEALSRGAIKAVMVEYDRTCLKVIERNIEHLDFKDKAVALKANVLTGLEWLEHYSGYEGYDIIFMGPPYRDKENLPLAYSTKTVELVFSSKIMAEGCIVINQRHKNEPLQLPEDVELYKEVKYGDTLLSFMKKRK